jgi:hypothetical protein
MYNMFAEFLGEHIFCGGFRMQYRQKIIFTVAFMLCLCATEKVIAASEQDDLPPQKDLLGMPFTSNELWYQYLNAGEAATRKNDVGLARRYYLGALSTLEKKQSPQKGDPLFLVRVSSLENHVMKMYSNVLGKEMDSDDKLKWAEEQVGTYERMAQLNQRFAAPGDLFASKAQERVVKVRADLEKLKSEIASEKGKESAATK